MNRRNFLKISGLSAATLSCAGSPFSRDRELSPDARSLPVFQRDLFKNPVIIASLKLFHNRGHYLLQARSTDGAEGYAVANQEHMAYLYPLLLKRIIPFFLGRDARDIEELIHGVYVHNSNYKLQGLAFWVCLATVEFALFDMMGRIASVPMGALIGTVQRREISVYRANNYRGKSAEESVALIQKNCEESGARAVKFKVGGRMSKNQDDPPGRTEALIPLVRKVLGDDITIYADSNGSYDAANAIRVGRLLQEINAGFFEEPCPFDHYQDTLRVAQSLEIPIAGGEQDSSMWLMQWMIEQKAVQVIQPDLFYFGGLVRCARVARMAEAAGIPCTPHISGNGLGYLYMAHFVSAINNPGPYHEYKGIQKDIPFTCADSDLRPVQGVLRVPGGPGLGIEIAPAFIETSTLVG
jgi:L-alanine-DL-glutamate epimerase-like enolase superfamily enzyme